MNSSPDTFLCLFIQWNKVSVSTGVRNTWREKIPEMLIIYNSLELNNDLSESFDIVPLQDLWL